MTFDERTQAVAKMGGFTERQARFLVTVMLHAGVCVPRHPTQRHRAAMTWTSASSMPGGPSQHRASRRCIGFGMQDGDRALAELGSGALNDAVIAIAGRVETLELGHRYGHLSPLVTIA
jgi:hypothetical protein